MVPVRLCFLLYILVAFNQPSASSPVVGSHTKDQFDDYWYSKGAEISRFTLNQARYGGVHKGDAVLIFVTETMNPKLQVKADHLKKSNIPVLKLNATRKFYTGIYPYSIMMSIFSPIDTDAHPLPLKMTFTSQEWCGQVFMQINLKNDEYHVQSRSYFEAESDSNFTLKKELSEDALWTLIRTAPQKLPTGEFRLLPGAMYTRLLHRPFTVLDVIGSLTSTDDKSLEGVNLVRYEVRIPQEDRILRITFEKEFPYRIQEWKDTHGSIFNRQPLTTHAIRTHTIMTDYWNKNKNSDRILLKKLGLKDNQ